MLGQIQDEVLDSLFDAIYLVDRNRRINFWNRAAEALTGFRRDEVVGRRCPDGVLRHVDEEGTMLCREGCPLQRTIDIGENSEAEVFLHHKDGHRVPVVIRVAPIHDESGNVVGAVEVFRNVADDINRQKRMEELESMAFIDPLTGLANRRFLMTSLNGRLDEFNRYKWPFGILFFDIDHFKQVNDTHGHDIGDEVLKMVAATLGNNTRPFDLAGRYGGEEFLVIVANVDVDQLMSIAERFRILIEKSGLREPLPLSVTVSIGAALIREGDTAETLIKRADTRLYRAKEAGRNRIVCGDD
jgi:diguanylate cyclase (GGDEF)-like protein/PAS domain S-box-containing protein